MDQRPLCSCTPFLNVTKLFSHWSCSRTLILWWLSYHVSFQRQSFEELRCSCQIDFDPERIERHCRSRLHRFPSQTLWAHSWGCSSIYRLCCWESSCSRGLRTARLIVQGRRSFWLTQVNQACMWEVSGLGLGLLFCSSFLQLCWETLLWTLLLS
jgi:hypothetical protein